MLINWNESPPFLPQSVRHHTRSWRYCDIIHGRGGWNFLQSESAVNIRGLNLFYFSWLKLDQGSCLVPWWYLPFCPLAWSLRPPWTLWTLWTLWMLSKRIAAHISRWLSYGDQKMLSLFSNDKFCQSIFNAFPAYSMHMKVSGKITGEHRWGASRALQKEEEGVVVWFGILYNQLGILCNQFDILCNQFGILYNQLGILYSWFGIL